MSGSKRNPDKLNTFGVVVVGICGAVMVYVAITALQAFYMNDTSELQTMQDYGGQDTTAKSHKAEELEHINKSGTNPAAGGAPQTFHIPIDVAEREIADEAAKPNFDPSHIIPALPPQTTPTIEPIFRHGAQPQAPAAGSAAPVAPAGSAAAPAAAGSAEPAAAGSAAAGSAAAGQPTGGHAP